MYPTTATKSDAKIVKNSYEFYSEENSQKWKGLLVNALEKVHNQVNLPLSATPDALGHVEALILKMLGMLCAAQPKSIHDMEEHVQKTFPHPIDKWAISDAQKALEKGRRKSSLILPVDKLHQLINKELILGYKIDMQTTMYIVAVLEYIGADILKLTGNYVKAIKHSEITSQDVKVAMCADKILMDMFFQDEEVAVCVEEELPSRRRSLTYEDVVTDFIFEERQYMRDLEMIINVFRQPFIQIHIDNEDIDLIFSRICDVYETTVNLVINLEDIKYMMDQDCQNSLGAMLLEMAENAEFHVYKEYCDDILSGKGFDKIKELMNRSDTYITLKSISHGFNTAVKYVLPGLLHGPIYHCLHYFEIIKYLSKVSRDDTDTDDLEQTYGALLNIKVHIEESITKSEPKINPSELSLNYHRNVERPAAMAKMTELSKNIDGWEAADILKSCNKFLLEGILYRHSSRQRLAERHVFLFDNIMLITKQYTKRSSVSGQVGDFKLKETVQVVRLKEISDKEDSEGPPEMKHAFELIFLRDHMPITFSAKSAEDKQRWMAALVSLHTQSTLNRILDSKLLDDEQPLILPPKEEYRFTEEDSELNIKMEQNGSGDGPIIKGDYIIKGGTLPKLIERLTYHTYSEHNLSRTFLNTYRPFAKPIELLDLLIERFNIPVPEIVPNGDYDAESLKKRRIIQRLLVDYCKPVQMRVLNVIKHWVDQHWYDFEGNEVLQKRLITFLNEGVKRRAHKKYAQIIQKMMSRKLEMQHLERQITHCKPSPKVEWHLTKSPAEFDLMTLHPIEIARQVTLLEYEMYQAVKPSELVGCVWVKENKKKTSPNLMKMMHHTNMFTFWLEKCIIETKNFEERVQVVARILEITAVFLELNNFNGALEVMSALNSASIYRLSHTLQEVKHLHHRFKNIFEEANSLNSDHFKPYKEKLRSINPPCVPFLGMYLTNILKTEEGNPDYLKGLDGVINVSKLRMVADIIQEIQQYQMEPYCLTSEPDIRAFIESLDPLGGLTGQEFQNYLYEESLILEPRNCKQPSRFEKKYTYSLKSPGVKGSSRHHSVSTLPWSGGSSHTPSLSSALSTAALLSNMQEEASKDDMQSMGSTPPLTPSTPLTPTQPEPVFEAICLPNASSQFNVSHGSTVNTATSLNNVPPPLPSIEDIPPPLPPRQRRNPLIPLQRPPVKDGGPPSLPPRNGDPPPLPPRGTSFDHSSHSPRHSHTAPIKQQQFDFSQAASFSQHGITRRNSERTGMDVNGERHDRMNQRPCLQGSFTPELPPKTYRVSHSRNPSS